MKSFKPHHLNATQEDLSGNHGLGRYVILPGSDGRAKEISAHFDNLTVNKHSRGHDLYLGTITAGSKRIDVATVSSGMGCPSMEIFLHELFYLGAKRFLRVGTAGSLQPNTVKLCDIINAQASVRDESTTLDYVPAAFPAVASLACTQAVLEAAQKLNLIQRVHTGIVHCKASFYGREYGAGPQGKQNLDYMDMLSNYGVLATEMETAALFTQSQYYNQLLSQQGTGPQFQVITGAILGIMAIPPTHYPTAAQAEELTKSIIQLALQTVRELAVEIN